MGSILQLSIRASCEQRCVLYIFFCHLESHVKMDLLIIIIHTLINEFIQKFWTRMHHMLHLRTCVWSRTALRLQVPGAFVEETVRIHTQARSAKWYRYYHHPLCEDQLQDASSKL